MTTAWAVTDEKVQAAIQKIVEVRHPRRIILFGSYIRGDGGRDSDLDILVVTDEVVGGSRCESVRIRRLLKGITMPMDILVISERQLDEVADVPGMIYREALTHGEVVYESTR